MNRTCINCLKPLTTRDQKKYCSGSCAAKCNNTQRVNKKIANNKELIEKLINDGTPVTEIIKQVGICIDTFKRMYPEYRASHRNKNHQVNQPPINKVQRKISLSRQQYLDRLKHNRLSTHAVIFESIRQTGSPGVNTQWQNQKTWLKRFLINRDGTQCSRCGWNEANPTTGNVMTELDHIDGNNQNNILNNVRLLCPNCHSLTPTYRYIKRE